MTSRHTDCRQTPSDTSRALVTCDLGPVKAPAAAPSHLAINRTISGAFHENFKINKRSGRPGEALVVHLHFQVKHRRVDVCRCRCVQVCTSETVSDYLSTHAPQMCRYFPVCVDVRVCVQVHLRFHFRSVSHSLYHPPARPPVPRTCAGTD